MEFFSKFWRILYSAYCLFTFYFSLFCLFISYLFLCFLPDKTRTLLAYKCNRLAMAIWLKITGFKVQIWGAEKMDKNQTYMFVCNHSNLLDLPVTGYFLQHYYKSLAKKEFIYIPFLGFLMQIMSVFVDRKSAESRAKSQEKINQLIKKGVSILIFPEGTRNKTESLLTPFYLGAFKTAIATKIPIQPFLFLNIRRCQKTNGLLFYSGTITVKVLDPIPTDQMIARDVEHLKNYVQAVMLAEMEGQEQYL